RPSSPPLGCPERRVGTCAARRARPRMIPRPTADLMNKQCRQYDLRYPAPSGDQIAFSVGATYILHRHAAQSSRWSPPLRDLEAPLDGGPLKPALEPGGNLLQFAEGDEFARAVKVDEIAHPAEHRDVGDGVVAAHDPGSLREARLDDRENALGLVAIAVERTLVLDLPAGEFVEKADLAEHRADRGHLEEQPLDRLVAPRGISGDELARLLGEIEEDRARFEQEQRLASRARGIDDRWDLAIRIERQELGRLLVALAEVDEMRLVGKADFLEHDRDLDPVRRRQGIKLEPLRMNGRPAFCNGKGGEIGHV